MNPQRGTLLCDRCCGGVGCADEAGPTAEGKTFSVLSEAEAFCAPDEAKAALSEGEAPGLISRVLAPRCGCALAVLEGTADLSGRSSARSCWLHSSSVIEGRTTIALSDLLSKCEMHEDEKAVGDTA